MQLLRLANVSNSCYLQQLHLTNMPDQLLFTIIALSKREKQRGLQKHILVKPNICLHKPPHLQLIYFSRPVHMNLQAKPIYFCKQKLYVY